MIARGGMIRALAVAVLCVLALAGQSAAASGAAGALSDVQRQALTTALNAQPKPAYEQVVRDAVGAGLPCDGVVADLCGREQNAPDAVERIVSAAFLEPRCDVDRTICSALGAGADLAPVGRAAFRRLEGTLSGEQRKLLAAALAAQPRQSYEQIYGQALARGIPCETTEAFLIAEAGKDEGALERIVAAAVAVCGRECGEAVTCRALLLGAPLRAVVRGALRARFTRQEIAAFARCGCYYSPEQIALVFLGLFDAGGAGATPGWGGGTGGPPVAPGPPGPPITPPPASPSVP